jgi:hypothetical protein
MVHWVALLVVKGAHAAAIHIAHAAAGAGAAHSHTVVAPSLVGPAHGVVHQVGMQAGKRAALELGKHAAAKGLFDSAARAGTGHLVTASVHPLATHAVHSAGSAAGLHYVHAAGHGSGAAIGSVAQEAKEGITASIAIKALDKTLKKYDVRMAARLERIAKVIWKRQKAKRSDLARALRLDPDGATFKRTLNEALRAEILTRPTTRTYGPGAALAG